jgi:HlyD family secretion protein
MVPTEDEKSNAKSDKKFECVSVKVGDKAKIRVVKREFKTMQILKLLVTKGDVVITGPYTTVSKDLNSGDKVSVKNRQG